ncbi:MAG TPA: lactonase family protein [Opitutaceae bacterium]|nr:lactonase family protein [Opitutaceae bacterium]
MRPLLLLLTLALGSAACPARDVFVYVGTFTNFNGRDTGSKGIYLGRLDLDTGKLGTFALTAEGANPSFLALAPDHRHLYATSEVAMTDGKPVGGVYAFSINSANGGLQLLNRANAGGPGPTHIAIDPSGRMAAVANYDNGSIATLPILSDAHVGEPATYIEHKGKSVDPKRQDHAYAHSVTFSPDGRFLFSDDLGTDKIYGYSVDAAHAAIGPLDPSWVAVKPGSGPRHLALHPDGRHVYVVSEMASTVSVFTYNSAQGSFSEEPVQVISTLPADFKGTSTGAEVAVHPSGRFLYTSNRGLDSIALFQIDATGRLTFVETVSTMGKTPRHFALDPSGHWLVAANQNSNSLVVFRVDPASGRLTAAGSTVELPAPVCVLFAN